MFQPTQQTQQANLSNNTHSSNIVDNNGNQNKEREQKISNSC